MTLNDGDHKLYRSKRTGVIWEYWRDQGDDVSLARPDGNGGMDWTVVPKTVFEDDFECTNVIASVLHYENDWTVHPAFKQGDPMTIPGFTRTDTGLTCDRCSFLYVDAPNQSEYVGHAVLDVDGNPICTMSPGGACRLSHKLAEKGCLYCGDNAADRVFVSRDGTREPLVVTRFTGQTTDLPFCAEGYKVKGRERTVPVSWVHADFRPETAAERRERWAAEIHEGTHVTLTSAPNDDDCRAVRKRTKGTVNNLLNDRKAKAPRKPWETLLDTMKLLPMEDVHRAIDIWLHGLNRPGIEGITTVVMDDSERSEYIKRELSGRQPKVYVQTDEDGDV